MYILLVLIGFIVSMGLLVYSTSKDLDSRNEQDLHNLREVDTNENFHK